MVLFKTARVCNMTQENRKDDETYHRCRYELFGICMSHDECIKTGNDIYDPYKNETLDVSPEIGLLVKMLSITRYQNNQILKNQKMIMDRITKLEQEKIK